MDELEVGEALKDIHFLGKPLCIFENHAQALLPWSRWRTKLGKPLKLITLDHHSDTNSCYLRSLFKKIGRDVEEMERLRTLRLNAINYENESDVINGLEGLYHDEHIHAALKLGVITQAYVIQHSFDVIDPSLAERGMQVLPTEVNLKADSEEVKQESFDRVLESDFLTRQLEQFKNSEIPFDMKKDDYILDIDLDVFKSKKSVQPECHRVYKELADHAVAITIARESEWVSRLSYDKDLTVEFLEEQTLKLMES